MLDDVSWAHNSCWILGETSGNVLVRVGENLGHFSKSAHSVAKEDFAQCS